MVSIMDSAKAATDPSISCTSRVRSLRTGSPYCRMVRPDTTAILTGYPAGPASDGRRIDRHPEPSAPGPGHRREEVTEGAVIRRLH